MKSDNVLFGDRDAFAIECNIEFQTDTPAQNAAGLLWFWIGGDEVGNRDVVSLPGIAASELRQTLQWCGHRNEPSLYGAEAKTVLDTIHYGLYDSPGTTFAEVQNWGRFLICMLPGGHEYMDGWFTVMVESPEGCIPRRDRVLYRGNSLSGDREVLLPHRTYKAVVQEFLDWFAAHKRIGGSG